MRHKTEEIILPYVPFVAYFLGGDSFAPEAARDLFRVERVAFHQHLNQATNRLTLRRHNRAGTFELLVDQLGRRFFHLVEQALAALLIRLAEMNRSEAAHT